MARVLPHSRQSRAPSLLRLYSGNGKDDEYDEAVMLLRALRATKPQALRSIVSVLRLFVGAAPTKPVKTTAAPAVSSNGHGSGVTRHQLQEILNSIQAVWHPERPDR